MLVMLFGISTLVRLLHSENAWDPMLVTPDSMTTDLIFAAAQGDWDGG